MIGHTAAQCDDRKGCCRRCQCRHHQSICEHSFQITNQSFGNSMVQKNNLNPESNPFNTNTTTCANTNSGVILHTATATAISEDGSKTTCVKILFDNGSQRTYVSKNLKYKLGLKSKGNETLNLNTFGEKKLRKQRCELLQLKLRPSDGDDREFKFDFQYEYRYQQVVMRMRMRSGQQKHKAVWIGSCDNQSRLDFGSRQYTTGLCGRTDENKVFHGFF